MCAACVIIMLVGGGGCVRGFDNRLRWEVIRRRRQADGYFFFHHLENGFPEEA